MITITRTVSFRRRSDKTKALIVHTGPPAPPLPAGRIPRVARLMALAITFDQMIREGKVADQSDLARLVRVTQPRLTQIMNLNHLAPEIQEQVLHLAPITTGRERIHERSLRPIAATVDWQQQRRMWKQLVTGM